MSDYVQVVGDIITWCDLDRLVSSIDIAIMQDNYLLMYNTDLTDLRQQLSSRLSCISRIQKALFNELQHDIVGSCKAISNYISDLKNAANRRVPTLPSITTGKNITCDMLFATTQLSIVSIDMANSILDSTVRSVSTILEEISHYSNLYIELKPLCDLPNKQHLTPQHMIVMNLIAHSYMVYPGNTYMMDKINEWKLLVEQHRSIANTASTLLRVAHASAKNIVEHGPMMVTKTD
jgi:hypothetical protein